MKKNVYQCSTCGIITWRDSDKKRIKSHCEEYNKDAFLVRVDEAHILTKSIKEMREKYLPNIIGLDSFKKKDQRFLEIAFEAGATVMFNKMKIV